MSIDKHFDGNFAIFPTDYNQRSLEYIYDYAVYRASLENRSIIIICTSAEKEVRWNRIVNLYDINSLIGLRVPCEGFRNFEGVNDFYQDAITLQSIIIIDGAHDLIYGNQSLDSLPEDEIAKRKEEWYQKAGELHIDKSWETNVKEEYKMNYMSPQDIFDTFDDCLENKIFLIAECPDTDISLDTFIATYPELDNHGDSIVGIVDRGSFVDEIPLVKRPKRRMHDIKENMILSQDMHNMYDWDDKSPIIAFL